MSPPQARFSRSRATSLSIIALVIACDVVTLSDAGCAPTQLVCEACEGSGADASSDIASGLPRLSRALVPVSSDLGDYDLLVCETAADGAASCGVSPAAMASWAGDAAPSANPRHPSHYVESLEVTAGAGFTAAAVVMLGGVALACGRYALPACGRKAACGAAAPTQRKQPSSDASASCLDLGFELRSGTAPSGRRSSGMTTSNLRVNTSNDNWGYPARERSCATALVVAFATTTVVFAAIGQIQGNAALAPALVRAVDATDGIPAVVRGGLAAPLRELVHGVTVNTLATLLNDVDVASRAALPRGRADEQDTSCAAASLSISSLQTVAALGIAASGMDARLTALAASLSSAAEASATVEHALSATAAAANDADGSWSSASHTGDLLLATTADGLDVATAHASALASARDDVIQLEAVRNGSLDNETNALQSALDNATADVGGLLVALSVMSDAIDNIPDAAAAATILAREEGGAPPSSVSGVVANDTKSASDFLADADIALMALSRNMSAVVSAGSVARAALNVSALLLASERLLVADITDGVPALPDVAAGAACLARVAPSLVNTDETVISLPLFSGGSDELRWAEGLGLASNEVSSSTAILVDRTEAIGSVTVYSGATGGSTGIDSALDSVVDAAAGLPALPANAATTVAAAADAIDAWVAEASAHGTHLLPSGKVDDMTAYAAGIQAAKDAVASWSLEATALSHGHCNGAEGGAACQDDQDCAAFAASTCVGHDTRRCLLNRLVACTSDSDCADGDGACMVDAARADSFAAAVSATVGSGPDLSAELTAMEDVVNAAAATAASAQAASSVLRAAAGLGVSDGISAVSAAVQDAFAAIGSEASSAALSDASATVDNGMSGGPLDDGSLADVAGNATAASQLLASRDGSGSDSSSLLTESAAVVGAFVSLQEATPPLLDILSNAAFLRTVSDAGGDYGTALLVAAQVVDAAVAAIQSGSEHAPRFQALPSNTSTSLVASSAVARVGLLARDPDPVGQRPEDGGLHFLASLWMGDTAESLLVTPNTALEHGRARVEAGHDGNPWADDKWCLSRACGEASAAAWADESLDTLTLGALPLPIGRFPAVASVLAWTVAVAVLGVVAAVAGKKRPQLSKCGASWLAGCLFAGVPVLFCATAYTWAFAIMPAVDTCAGGENAVMSMLRRNGDLPCRAVGGTGVATHCVVPLGGGVNITMDLPAVFSAIAAGCEAGDGAVDASWVSMREASSRSSLQTAADLIAATQLRGAAAAAMTTAATASAELTTTFFNAARSGLGCSDLHQAWATAKAPMCCDVTVAVFWTVASTWVLACAGCCCGIPGGILGRKRFGELWGAEFDVARGVVQPFSVSVSAKYTPVGMSRGVDMTELGHKEDPHMGDGPHRQRPMRRGNRKRALGSKPDLFASQAMHVTNDDFLESSSDGASTSSDEEHHERNERRRAAWGNSRGMASLARAATGFAGAGGGFARLQEHPRGAAFKSSQVRQGEATGRPVQFAALGGERRTRGGIPPSGKSFRVLARMTGGGNVRVTPSGRELHVRPNEVHRSRRFANTSPTSRGRHREVF